MELAAVVMAAGKGTRMNDPSRAKVMFPIGGVPMIDHVVSCALELDADPIIVVIGYNREALRVHLQGRFSSSVGFAEQVEQLGTGHAVMQAAPMLQGFRGDVLVLSGDVPLLGRDTLAALIEHHRTNDGVATVLSVDAPDPTGYGRILRNPDGSVASIVEHRDATDEERLVREINSGIYLFAAPDLLEALDGLDNNNAQGEYYLTDVFAWFRGNGRRVAAWKSDDFQEVQGINTIEQLADVDIEFIGRNETK